MEPSAFALSRRMLTARPSLSTLVIAAVMAFFTVITWRWSWNQGPSIIRSDAEGYYAYMRAVFINGDLGRERPNWTYLHDTDEGTLNKYFAGEAVMLTPFFLAAHGWAHATGAETDGLSEPYERAIGIAGLVYALLGLLALRSVLRAINVDEMSSAIVLAGIGLGTQLVQYVCIQPGWSHVYSFCMVNVFLLSTVRLAAAPVSARAIGWGLSLGLVILLRPVNALVLFAVPVLLGNATWTLARVFWGRWRLVLMMGAACALVVCVQSVLWYAQVGHFIADGYRGEGFHWGRPEIRQVLVGFRRGLFLWTPVLVPAALCVLVLWCMDRLRAVAAVVYWTVNTYVISSWWIWYYGSGWGARVFVDHYPVLFLPLALVLTRWRRYRVRNWWIAVVLLVLLSSFTLAQFYQYNHRLIHQESMDSRKYAYSFLRFDDAHRDRLGGMYRIAPYNPNGLDTLLHEKWDAEGTWSHWSGRRIRMDGAPSPAHVAVCDRVDAFGPAFILRSGEFPTGRELFVAIGYERYVESVEDTRDIICITTLEDTGSTHTFYEPFAMEPVPPEAPGTWEHIEYRIHVPAARPGEDLKFYFWNRSHASSFRADDLDVTVMAVRPYSAPRGK
jgi:hypothetical protein